MNFKNGESGNVFDELYVIIDFIIIFLVLLLFKEMVMSYKLPENLFEKISLICIIALLSNIISMLKKIIYKK